MCQNVQELVSPLSDLPLQAKRRIPDTDTGHLYEYLRASFSLLLCSELREVVLHLCEFRAIRESDRNSTPINKFNRSHSSHQNETWPIVPVARASRLSPTPRQQCPSRTRRLPRGASVASRTASSTTANASTTTSSAAITASASGRSARTAMASLKRAATPFVPRARANRQARRARPPRRPTPRCHLRHSNSRPWPVTIPAASPAASVLACHPTRARPRRSPRPRCSIQASTLLSSLPRA